MATTLRNNKSYSRGLWRYWTEPQTTFAKMIIWDISFCKFIVSEVHWLTRQPWNGCLWIFSPPHVDFSKMFKKPQFNAVFVWVVEPWRAAAPTLYRRVVNLPNNPPSLSSSSPSSPSSWASSTSTQSSSSSSLVREAPTSYRVVNLPPPPPRLHF